MSVSALAQESLATVELGPLLALTSLQVTREHRQGYAGALSTADTPARASAPSAHPTRVDRSPTLVLLVPTQSPHVKPRTRSLPEPRAPTAHRLPTMPDLSSFDLPELHRFASDLACQAGSYLRDQQLARTRAGGASTGLDESIEIKENAADLVTRADMHSEQLISDAIRARYPTHKCVVGGSLFYPCRLEAGPD